MKDDLSEETLRSFADRFDALNGTGRVGEDISTTTVEKAGDISTTTVQNGEDIVVGVPHV